jgi:predicted alpha/beta superfamily hydrolase
MSSAVLSAIAGVDTFVVEPPGLGAALRISVAPPATPAFGAPTTEPCAVIYVTDADMCFGSVTEAARLMAYAGDIAPAYVVGIGYAEETGDYAFTSSRRALDFYKPPHRIVEFPGLGSMAFGGADVFLRALLEQVLPEAERRYPRIDPSRRFLFGTSAGGHFAAYTLAQAPEAFAGYAMMSPNLRDWPPVPGEDVMLDAIAAMPNGAIPAGVRVFLSAGDSEDDPGTSIASAGIVSNIYRLRATLAGLGVETGLTVFQGETHTSVPGAAISRAVRYLLPSSGGR